jgi:hypothetical protein
MKQLLNLPGWPPQGGAGPFDTRKAAFDSSPESVIVKRVERIVGTRVDMTCIFGKEVVTFRYFATDKGMAENVAEVLRTNAGQSIRDLGMFLVPEGELELSALRRS